MNKKFLALVRAAMDEGVLFAYVPNVTDLGKAPSAILCQQTLPGMFDKHAKVGTFFVPSDWLDLRPAKHFFFDIPPIIGRMGVSQLKDYWRLSVALDGVPHMFAGKVGVMDHIPYRFIFFDEADAVLGRQLYDQRNIR